MSNLDMQEGEHTRLILSRGLVRAVMALLLAATNLTIWLPNSLGCECASPPPPCVAYAQTPMIFLGTAIEAIETKNGATVLARMRIDKAYKGVSEGTVVLYDDGMCDGPSLHLGEQYLMYTRDNGTGYLPSRGCTRSRSVKFADEDLAFLNSLPDAAPTGTISGQVTVSTGNIAREGKPASGVLVEILGEGERLTGTTDSEGRYSVSGLKPGAYLARATKLGFSSADSESEATAEIEARGCAVVDLVLRKNWLGAIGGHIIRSDGAAAPAGISLDLIRVEGHGPNQKSELLIGATVKTDDRSEYLFRGVAPGFYKIALNLYNVPTAKVPYRTVYWPAASTEGTASAIELGQSTSSRKCDFRLPVALESTPVDFVVLLPDGTPARELRANIGTQMDGMFQWAGEAITDASGRFSFGAIEGFEYTVMDIITDQATMASKVQFSASDGTQPITIRLVPKGQ